MSNTDAATELAELARAATWGLMKGGDLDTFEDGRAALLLRWDIIDAAARVGIIIDREGAGIGEIYTRTELEGLVRDFRPRDPDTGRIVH
ncbi:MULTISPECIES: hypothetical protein [unclassified Rhodococcus (in: high G+C Gram-positive bacteria)]|uniref:hypothetical protein n=1 Tax=unclassified Rhodococcus (in: high G+C Gram-positive bacteria) TaxID=192944 RepID=UPI000B9A8BA8|nr:MULTISPECIES: hypothetical protein [unclassified Rhodococcus (in: high G+C Gram-positive bacteria)]MBY4383749.1 hypothetical protein [Rhodococcus fascians]MBY4399640.1 hypothetical protein [Rhodococcus fascians]MBY4409446.1 hypothetical protein [Rhodococcus fascians]MBY4424227.1 hypothetical protein [Rhodococcus fascians]MBY4462939.1 hypothetical protein [Rhodococcus fascians]